MKQQNIFSFFWSALWNSISILDGLFIKEWQMPPYNTIFSHPFSTASELKGKGRPMRNSPLVCELKKKSEVKLFGVFVKFLKTFQVHQVISLSFPEFGIFVKIWTAKPVESLPSLESKLYFSCDSSTLPPSLLSVKAKKF